MEDDKFRSFIKDKTYIFKFSTSKFKYQSINSIS